MHKVMSQGSQAAQCRLRGLLYIHRVNLPGCIEICASHHTACLHSLPFTNIHTGRVQCKNGYGCPLAPALGLSPVGFNCLYLSLGWMGSNAHPIKWGISGCYFISRKSSACVRIPFNFYNELYSFGQLPSNRELEYIDKEMSQHRNCWAALWAKAHCYNIQYTYHNRTVGQVSNPSDLYTVCSITFDCGLLRNVFIHSIIHPTVPLI